MRKAALFSGVFALSLAKPHNLCHNVRGNASRAMDDGRRLGCASVVIGFTCRNTFNIHAFTAFIDAIEAT